IPAGRGTVFQSQHGVHLGDVNIQWWAARIQNLNASLGYIDPTHLPLYLTRNVMLFFGNDPFNTGVTGFHGADKSENGNGSQPVQTFAWASYLAPVPFADGDGGNIWAYQDIHIVSHEIAEWAHNPFITNTVEPWLLPTFGFCGGNLLETGDPVELIGFAMGTNTYFQGPDPDGTQSADGYYPPEDEVFLPSFMQLGPNNTSDPTQSPSPNSGRYTLMGDLNPFPGYHQPATGCN